MQGSQRNISSEAAPVINFRSEPELLAQIKISVEKAGKNEPAENDDPGTEN